MCITFANEILYRFNQQKKKKKKKNENKPCDKHNRAIK